MTRQDKRIILCRCACRYGSRCRIAVRFGGNANISSGVVSDESHPRAVICVDIDNNGQTDLDVQMGNARTHPKPIPPGVRTQQPGGRPSRRICKA